MSGSDAKMIKSAQRALKVLECFDPETPRATVMGVARRLGYPQSSTSELLGCLVGLGYLNYDRFRRTYEPTARVPLLGAWVQTSLFRCGRLLPALDQIARATGETVVLSIVVGLAIQRIHVIPGQNAGALRPVLGSTRSMLYCSGGRLFMSRFTDKRVKSLLHRINAEENHPGGAVKLETLMADLATIHQQGYAAEFGEFDPEIGAFSMLLASRGGQMLAVGLLGSPSTLKANADSYLGVMRSALKQVTRPIVTEEFYLPTPIHEPTEIGPKILAAA